MEADLLSFLMGILEEKEFDRDWYPHTLFYARYAQAFPLFVRATHPRGFENLAEITGIRDANTIREAIRRAFERYRQMGGYQFPSIDFGKALNLDNLNGGGAPK